MNLLAFLAFFTFVYPFSFLPFPVLYLVSDFLYFFLYRIIGYRKKVVKRNLKKSFPRKTHRELEKIEKQFYKNLCDLFVESLKSFSISREEILKRVVIEKTNILDDLFKADKSVVLVLGHCGNWEWTALSASIHVKHQMVTIYKRIRNPYLDNFFKKSRGKFGLKLIEMKDVAKFYSSDKTQPIINAFVIDQTPSNTKSAFWVDFMNQETAVLPGAEKIARKYNHVVVFAHILRIKRGYYRTYPTVIVENPENTKPGEITETHVKMLEKQISENPSDWLWSHRRWKHRQKTQNFLTQDF